MIHDVVEVGTPITIGRKNYLFAKTEAGAEANAIWYTFIQTAKLNQLKVREYLEHLLSAFAWTEKPVWEASVGSRNST